MPHVMKNFGCKGQRWIKNVKKLETIPAWQFEKVNSKKEVIKEAQNNKNIVPLCFIHAHLSSKECGVGITSPQVQTSLHSEVDR